MLALTKEVKELKNNRAGKERGDDGKENAHPATIADANQNMSGPTA